MSNPQATQDPTLYQSGYLYGFGPPHHPGPATFGTIYGELQGIITPGNPYGATYYNPALGPQLGGAGVHLSALELNRSAKRPHSPPSENNIATTTPESKD